MARYAHEVKHGEYLAAHDPEAIWGWSTPAGKLRAERRAELIAQGAELRPGKRVLEIGCGTGLFTEKLARTGATIVAVDISEPLVQLGRNRGLDPQQVRFICKPFEACDEEGPFDAVVGSSILHHLTVEPALRRCHELLKPGGRFSFAEPNMLNPQIALQKNVPWIKRRLGDSPDETAFVAWQLRSLLASIGFAGIRITPFDWLHPATPRPLIGTIGQIGGVLERLPLLRAFAGSLHIVAQRP